MAHEKDSVLDPEQDENNLKKSNSLENWELSKIYTEPKPVEMYWRQHIFYYLRNLYAA